MNLSKNPYKGCRDFFPIDMRVRQFVEAKMKNAALAFGFEAYDGPLLEEVELYKAKSGEELINEQIYSFTDRGERLVAIRPEMTPTLARMVAQVHKELPKPLRWFSIPNLMRYEKPQKGRLREHWQFNCDVFGAPENLGEVEIFSLICFFLESFGANNSMFSIKINDRRIVDSLFNDVFELLPEDSYRLYKIIDRAPKISEEALNKLISEVQSLKGKEEILKEYLKLKDFSSLKAFLEKYNLKSKTSTFFNLLEKLNSFQFKKYFEYEPTIVRGLDYYTGVVFEVFDKNPENRRAIAGGGAYGNLLQIFNESPLPGIGFGMGDVTLVDFLKSHNLLPDFSHADNHLFMCYFDESCEEDILKLSMELRINDCKIETNLGVINFKKMFSLAEKKGHHFVAFMGTEEKEKKTIQVRNLTSKETKTFNLDEIINISSFIKI